MSSRTVLRLGSLRVQYRVSGQFLRWGARSVDEPVGDVGLDHEEHLRGSLGDLDKDSVVDLEETEELEDLAGLGGNVVDTARRVVSAFPLLHRPKRTYPLMRITK